MFKAKQYEGTINDFDATKWPTYEEYKGTLSLCKKKKIYMFEDKAKGRTIIQASDEWNSPPRYYSGTIEQFEPSKLKSYIRFG